MLVNTRVEGVEMTAPCEAEALLLSNKQGLTAVKARVYVDCSGDGDVAAWAGAEFEQGNETGELQPQIRRGSRRYVTRDRDGVWRPE